MNKYIIGAGLNGLIASYYLKDYYLIDKKENIGGQFVSKFPLGPHFIHYNKKFEKLLKELKIKYTIKVAKTAYYYKQKIHKKLTKEMIKEYSLKTRNSNDDKHFLNNKNRNFKYLDFDFKKFINAIFKKIKNRFINNLVEHVDIKSNIVILDNNRKLPYDKLISTIHYKNFCKLSNLKYKSKNKDIYFFCYKNMLRNNFKFKSEFDFIYVIDKDNYVNRVSLYKDFLIVEATKEIDIDVFELLDFKILKDYKLSNKNKVRKFKNITFLGRYANLDNSKKINDIIRDVKNV